VEKRCDIDSDCSPKTLPPWCTRRKAQAKQQVHRPSGGKCPIRSAPHTPKEPINHSHSDRLLRRRRPGLARSTTTGLVCAQASRRRRPMTTTASNVATIFFLSCGGRRAVESNGRPLPGILPSSTCGLRWRCRYCTYSKSRFASYHSGTTAKHVSSRMHAHAREGFRGTSTIRRSTPVDFTAPSGPATSAPRPPLRPPSRPPPWPPCPPSASASEAPPPGRPAVHRAIRGGFPA
jgi:hypothetical protein